MLKTIYVGNLPPDISKDEIRELLSQHGVVHSVRLAVDRETGNFRGFGFVEMEEEEASEAARVLAGTDLRGFDLRAAVFDVLMALLRSASGDRRLKAQERKYAGLMKLEAALAAIAQKTKEVKEARDAAWEEFCNEIVQDLGKGLIVYAGAATHVDGDISIAEALRLTVRLLEQAKDEARDEDD